MEDKDYLSVVLVVIALIAVALFAFSIIKTNPAQDYIPEESTDTTSLEGQENEGLMDDSQEVSESTPSEEVDDNNDSENLTGMDEIDSHDVDLSDLEMIKTAFSEKYSKSLDDVNVVISKNDGEFAQGGVSFSGEMGGGWFLAAKVDDEWVIVADGNGSVMCADIEDYDFDTNMVPECYDEATQKIVER